MNFTGKSVAQAPAAVLWQYIQRAVSNAIGLVFMVTTHQVLGLVNNGNPHEFAVVLAVCSYYRGNNVFREVVKIAYIE